MEVFFFLGHANGSGRKKGIISKVNLVKCRDNIWFQKMEDRRYGEFNCIPTIAKDELLLQMRIPKCKNVVIRRKEFATTWILEL